LLFTFLFLAFAAVQYNDPDPWIWIPVYLIYAGLSFSAAFKPLNSIWYLFFFALAGVASFFAFPEHWEGIGTSMMNENTERARESLGLMICAAVALVSKRIS
jgi:Transmembrane family 220, helix